MCSLESLSVTRKTNRPVSTTAKSPSAAQCQSPCSEYFETLVKAADSFACGGRSNHREKGCRVAAEKKLPYWCYISHKTKEERPNKSLPSVVIHIGAVIHVVQNKCVSG